MHCIKYRDEDGNWYLTPNGAWVNSRRFARFFETEAYAQKIAAIKEKEKAAIRDEDYHPRSKIIAVNISKNWRS